MHCSTARPQSCRCSCVDLCRWTWATVLCWQESLGEYRHRRQLRWREQWRSSEVSGLIRMYGDTCKKQKKNTDTVKPTLCWNLSNKSELSTSVNVTSSTAPSDDVVTPASFGTAAAQMRVVRQHCMQDLKQVANRIHTFSSLLDRCSYRALVRSHSESESFWFVCRLNCLHFALRTKQKEKTKCAYFRVENTLLK